jgi:hypothetical protein
LQLYINNAIHYKGEDLMNLSKIEHDQYVERLDNPEYINAIDRYKMFTLLNNFSSQLKEGMRNKIDLSFSNVNNVVIG